jgi:hypothetical protein
MANEKQIRITSETFRLAGDDPTVPDAYTDPAVLSQVKKEAGIHDFQYRSPCTATAEHFQENVLDKGKYQRESNIRPGTDEWFKLWYSKPDITGESPTK